MRSYIHIVVLAYTALRHDVADDAASFYSLLEESRLLAPRNRFNLISDDLSGLQALYDWETDPVVRSYLERRIQECKRFFQGRRSDLSKKPSAN